MQILIISILLTVTTCNCPSKTFFSINDDFSRTCVPCSDDCAICYLSADKKPVCAFCEEGFFMNSGKTCKACVKNCSSCTGTDIGHCRSASEGHFYDLKTGSIESCVDQSCATCASQNQCTSCSEGFYQAAKTETENGVLLTCKTCEIEHCLFCSEKSDQVKSGTFNSCSLCRSGYSLVSGKCQKCPENCSYCREESGECSFCDRGYNQDKRVNACLPISLPNCFSVKESGECEICENHYFISDTGSCEPCKQKYPNCSFCSGKEENLMCLSCEMGFSLDKKSTCKRCIPNCNHCNPDSCLGCFSGFFYNSDENICEKCKLDNCEICRNADVCEECANGFYFSQKVKKCLPCKGNCLRCFDETEDCHACPVNFFTLQQQIVTQKKGSDNIFSNLLSIFVGFGPMSLGPVKVTEMRIVTKCVKECPKTLKGNDVVVNWAERKCALKMGDASTVVLPEPKMHEDILHTISKLKVKYDEEVKEIKTHSLEKKTEKMSAECFYNGILRREVKGDTNSYYICRCQLGFMGDNCQITSNLYDSTQHKLFEFLDEIQKEFIDHNHHHKQKFLKAMIQLNKFRMGRQVVSKLIEIIQIFLQKDKELDNKKQLYILYDAVLLNLFDLLEEIKKTPIQEFNASTELQTEKEELFGLIHHLIEMLETSLEDHVYLNSFLQSNNSEYFSLDTYSFMISEYKMQNYERGAGFVVRNSNIDTSYNVVESNKVQFEFEGDFDPKNLKNNVQIMTISAPLFEDKLKALNYKAVSNLLYVKFINPLKPHEVVYNKDNRIRKILIDVALNYLPVFDDIEKDVSCLALFFGKSKSSINGKALKFNENTKSVLCEFNAYFEFRNYYFGVMVSI